MLTHRNYLLGLRISTILLLSSALAVPAVLGAVVTSPHQQTVQLTAKNTADNASARSEWSQSLHGWHGVTLGYDMGLDDFEATQSSLVLGYSLKPGLKIVGGMSLISPSGYSYAALDLHPVRSDKRTFQPSFQIGFATLDTTLMEEDDRVDEEEYNGPERLNGIFLGLNVDFEVNDFATMNFATKYIANGLNNRQGASIGSLGVRINL